MAAVQPQEEKGELSLAVTDQNKDEVAFDDEDGGVSKQKPGGQPGKAGGKGKNGKEVTAKVEVASSTSEVVVAVITMVCVQVSGVRLVDLLRDAQTNGRRSFTTHAPPAHSQRHVFVRHLR